MRGPEQRGVTETKVFLLDPKRIMVQSVFSYGEVDAFWGTLGGIAPKAWETQGRLNQWAHWARAQGPRIFFLFEEPPTGCCEIIFKLIILLLPLMKPSSG